MNMNVFKPVNQRRSPACSILTICAPAWVTSWRSEVCLKTKLLSHKSKITGWPGVCSWITRLRTPNSKTNDSDPRIAFVDTIWIFLRYPYQGSTRVSLTWISACIRCTEKTIRIGEIIIILALSHGHIGVSCNIRNAFNLNLCALNIQYNNQSNYVILFLRE